MANLLLLVDRQDARRETAATAAARELAPVAGLRAGRCGSGPVTVVWAAAPAAPVGAVSDGAGGAVLWGEAIPGPGPHRQTVEEWRAAWSGPAAPAPCDGFHAGVVWTRAGTVRVGADLLGIFPLYWWSDGEVGLVGTSPELFRAHPCFAARLDVTGLAGILLTNGLVGGRTLWRGLRRLGPGQVLHGAGGGGWRETEQYGLPLSRAYEGLPFGAQVEVLGEAVRAAVGRHAPPGPAYGMLLSGGLDSRMLAGFLDAQHLDLTALTFGARTDLEMRCASGVARAIGARHRRADPLPAIYPRLADTLARWEHLAHGFNSVMDWGVHDAAGALPPRTITGYMADAIVGGSHVSWAYDPEARDLSFDRLFGAVNAWGIRPDVLKRLMILAGFEASVDDVIAELRAEYDAPVDNPAHRAWVFDLRHRQRFHVGGTAWITSFGSWPVLPVLDRRVLEVAAGMPVAALADRRLEQELVAARFPRLAALPLDRNSRDTRPLRPRLRHQLASFLRDRARELVPRHADGQGATTGRERRYYYRVYDLDSPGWRAVRRHAEAHRGALRSVCDTAALDALWPAPEAPVRLTDAIRDGSGLKLVLGLALVARDHPLS